jgi:ParB-like chromosome segregation protein Spo0J
MEGLVMSDKKVRIPRGKAEKPLTFPCLQTRMVPVSKVASNEYNPNEVASEEMKLLATSMEEDGVTQPVVAFYDATIDTYIVVDGFHRYSLMKDYFECEEIPVVVIDKSIQDRMASTIRHNRARGKHQVDLMSVMVERLLKLGWNDVQIAQHLGMEAEEVLRLKQMTGLAGLFKGQSYSRSWIKADEQLAEPV